MFNLETDIAILGTGPAALLCALEAERRGRSVAVVGPVRPGGFVPTYGLFHDQVVGTPLAPAVSGHWDGVDVHTDEGTVALERAYVRLDSTSAAALLWGQLAARVVDAFATGVDLQTDRYVVHTRAGQTIQAHRVIDATGHQPVAVERVPARRVQLALGATLEARHGLDRPLLMDFRGEDEVPTFLYALPLDADRVFVEETTLISEHPPPSAELESRLRARLARMGWTGPLLVNERCRIPMDAGLPDFGVVPGFGAAGGLVHPATGYQLAAALNLAGPFVAALDATWDQSAEDAAQAMWTAIWPTSARRAHALQTWGARFVADLGRSDQAAFLSSFLALPRRHVDAYLGPQASVGSVAGTMLRAFAALPFHLQRSVTRRALTRPTPLVRPLLGLQEAT
ncbi:MAG: lycopene cyclase family protein [Proteobacteria bacterium]|nr:lycopene cyclase family protein [Pseudomonadota bacterium]MCP4922299.1 lycopene cyclase family protein [Pseudomonadota bacterium]